MNVSWVIASGYIIDPVITSSTLKQVGPLWGSWTTLKTCNTDNVVCNDKEKAIELVQAGVNTSANFLTHKDYEFAFAFTDNKNVRYYGGYFADSVYNIEDIIAMHLVAANSDVVLLLGFNFGRIAAQQNQDLKSQLHRAGLMHSVIAQNPDVQWVAVDHSAILDPSYQTLSNFTCDTIENVLNLLA